MKTQAFVDLMQSLLQHTLVGRKWDTDTLTAFLKIGAAGDEGITQVILSKQLGYDRIEISRLMRVLEGLEGGSVLVKGKRQGRTRLLTLAAPGRTLLDKMKDTVVEHART